MTWADSETRDRAPALGLERHKIRHDETGLAKNEQGVYSDLSMKMV